MAGNIGFVFDQTTNQNPNAYPCEPVPYPPQFVSQPYPTFNQDPNAYGHVQPPSPYGTDSTNNFGAMSSWPNTTYPYPETNPMYGTQVDGGAYHAQQPHLATYNDGNNHVVSTAEYDSYGYGQNKGGNGIPGGKLGVVGGALAAGAGAALVSQILPKKLKKNKLIKYGLPLAGAGAAGYKLNQMNNHGKQNY